MIIKNIILIAGLLISLSSLAIFIPLTISYRKTLRIEKSMLNCPKMPKDYRRDRIKSMRKNYAIVCLFLLCVFIFGLTTSISNLMDTGNRIHLVVLLIQMISLIVSAFAIAIMQYKRSRFE